MDNIMIWKLTINPGDSKGAGYSPAPKKESEILTLID
jgi:hypothetical protein